MRDLSTIQPSELNSVLKELQGLKTDFVAGAAAGTQMNIAAMRSEDTILKVLQEDNVSGVTADDTANVSIVDTHAFATVTVAGVNDADTVTVNGTVYTFKDTPTAINHVKRTAGNNNANAAALASAINSYENRRVSPGKPNTPAVVASVVNAVVTVKAVDDGAGNGIVISNSGGGISSSGSGTAAASATCASVADADTVTINGVVFTAKTTLTARTGYGSNVDEKQFKRGVSDTADGIALRKAINFYESKYGTLDVVATDGAAGVVNLVPRTYKKGNLIDFNSSDNTRLAKANNTGNHLNSGSATGGIKSQTNLTNKNVTVIWFNKDNA